MVLFLPDQPPSKTVAIALAIIITAMSVGCASRSEPKDSGDSTVSRPYHSGNRSGKPQIDDETSEKIDYASDRDKLDKEVWADEIDAQQFEQYFVRLWDRIRNADDKGAFLEELDFRELAISVAEGVEPLEHGILRFRFASSKKQFDPSTWRQFTSKLRQSGYRLLETEWHHSKFEPSASPPHSIVSFTLHIARPLNGDDISDTAPQQRIVVRGNLNVTWEDGTAAVPDRATVDDVELLVRTGTPAFQHMLSCRRNPDEFASAHPIIVYDLNRDGYPEIIISRWNRVYWNEAGEKFRESRLLDHFEPLAEAGLVADVTSDGLVDFVTINRNGQLIVYRGNKHGHFPNKATIACEITAPETLCMTAGDIDKDGDLDLWVTQYKPSYRGGQMPTPYYDANDGEPSFLLTNRGDGTFTDNTVEAGLHAKRKRRTYSSSFVDLDDDSDLDLLVNSDYAGVDMYMNDGNGRFTDASDSRLPTTKMFGMAHTLADFDSDGKTDIYAIGMSSTTARRLDQMGLGREDQPDIHQMRREMGYGNRLFLRREEGYIASPHSADVARTGWSWGTTAFDFDLDGDRDIYVANGFRSGESCQDYCTTYWTHDIYTGNSTPSKHLASFFVENMAALNSNEISWNGFEHNSLLLNRGTQGFTNAAFLFGVGFEYDSRAVIGADLDRDGSPDLLVAEYEFIGQGFELSLHVLRNTLKTNNNWIGIDLDDAKNKRSPIGARVTVTTATRKQTAKYVTGDSFLSQHPATLHFGLGSENIESIEIQWTDGKTQRTAAVAPNQYIRLDR